MTAPIANPSAAFLQTLDALANEPRSNQSLIDWLDHLPQMAMETSLPKSLANAPCAPTDRVLDYANEVLNNVAKARPYLSALPYLRGTGKRSRIRVGLILALPREMLPWALEGRAIRLQPDGKIEPYENVSPARELLECAYTLACLGRALPPGSAREKSALLKPLSLLHNQVVGNRLVLRKDRVHSGTPARLHVFLYNTRPPELILNESPRRPTALEYRPDELMAAREDRSVRFYLRDPASDPLLVPPTLQALDPAMRAKIDEAYLRAQAAYQTLSLH